MVVCAVRTRLSNVCGITVQKFRLLMDFRKIVKASKVVFKPQHSECAKCTVETDGITNIGGLRLGVE